jgi:hypothetical protein
VLYTRSVGSGGGVGGVLCIAQSGVAGGRLVSSMGMATNQWHNWWQLKRSFGDGKRRFLGFLGGGHGDDDDVDDDGVVFGIMYGIARRCPVQLEMLAFSRFVRFLVCGENGFSEPVRCGAGGRPGGRRFGYEKGRKCIMWKMLEKTEYMYIHILYARSQSTYTHLDIHL